MNILEMRIHDVLGRLSNSESVTIKEEWIDDALAELKVALKRQFMDQDPRSFKLRMSSIGKPLCQLQMAKAGAPAERRPYNQFMRMVLGNCVEAIMEIVIRASGANVTGGKNKVQATYAGQVINGEDDIQIDGKEYDIKSCSDFAFKQKWTKGFEGLLESDDFGYAAQLIGYSDAQGIPTGGWIVCSKNTGEVAVVEADPTVEQLNKVRDSIDHTVRAIATDAPFKRCFTDEPETFNKKPTGNRVLGQTCGFCDFKKTCWPDAIERPAAMSKARDPKLVMYTEYVNDGSDK